MLKLFESLAADVYRGIRNLKFDQQRNPAVYKRQYIFKCRDRFRGAAQAAGFQFFKGQIFHGVRAAADPFQRIVMKDYESSVAGQVKVNFNSIAVLQRGLECGHGVFGNPLFYTVITPMCEHGVTIPVHVPSAGKTGRDGE